jgi:hypothetical protein
VNPATVPGHDDERKVFQQFLGHFGGPAFARRARDVQAAYDALLESCWREREERLGFVRLHLGTLFALAGSTAALAPILDSPDQAEVLNKLHADLQPQLRLPVAPTPKVRVWRGVLSELREALTSFNKRWLDFIYSLDLHKLNALRDAYNRFYLMEKECALGSARVARQGFQKLEPLTVQDILRALPLLPVPL